MTRFGPRAAVTAIFLLNGAMIGTWAARLSAVQDRVGADAGGLAIALAGAAVGSLIGMPVAGRILARRGSRTPVRAAVVLEAGALTLLGLAPTLPVLVLVAPLFGAVNGALDVAMNAHGVAVERRAGRPVLASMHAAWSIGALIGAGSASAMAALHVAVPLHFAGATLLIVLAGVAAGTRLLPASADAPEPRAGEARADARVPRGARRRLVVLGAVAFLSLLGEGAAADWSAVYVDDDLAAGAATAGLAYTSFTVAMTAARLVADRITTAIGPVALVRLGTAVAAAGLGPALLIGHPVAALAGFAALGMGLAPVIPVIFRAAGSLPGVQAGPALARTTTTGYLGLLAGPPLIGALAELTSLPLALGAVVAAVALVFVFADAVRVPAPPRAVPAPVPA